MVEMNLMIGGPCPKCGRAQIEHASGDCPPPRVVDLSGAVPWRRTPHSAESMLRRADALLTRWDEFYGKWCNGPGMDNALPPAGTVTLQEDIAEWLAGQGEQRP